MSITFKIKTAPNITFKLISRWRNTRLYIASDGYNHVQYEVERKKDKIGTLFTVDCNKTGYFQTYKHSEVINRIKQIFNHI